MKFAKRVLYDRNRSLLAAWGIIVLLLAAYLATGGTNQVLATAPVVVATIWVLLRYTIDTYVRRQQ